MPFVQAITYTLLNFLRAPFWWYSEGLISELKKLGRNIIEIDYLSGFSVWLTHIFVPMYGQTDWKGRLMSFLVRLFQVVVRGVFLAGLVAIRLSLTLLYVTGPILLVLGLIQSFNG